MRSKLFAYVNIPELSHDWGQLISMQPHDVTVQGESLKCRGRRHGYLSRYGTTRINLFGYYARVVCFNVTDDSEDCRSFFPFWEIYPKSPCFLPAPTCNLFMGSTCTCIDILLVSSRLSNRSLFVTVSYTLRYQAHKCHCRRNLSTFSVCKLNACILDLRVQASVMSCARCL